MIFMEALIAKFLNRGIRKKPHGGVKPQRPGYPKIQL